MNKKLDKQYDVKRLGRIVTQMTKIYALFEHMDEKEYRRMRDYISNRFSASFPYNNPSIAALLPTQPK